MLVAIPLSLKLLWLSITVYHIMTASNDLIRVPVIDVCFSCYLHVTNWAYNIGEMNLVTYSDKIVLDSYKPSAEWAITKTLVSR